MNFEQKQNIGFAFLTENLSPQSGFGKKALKNIAPFSDKELLAEEYKNLSCILQKLKTNNKIFDNLNNVLAHVKDIDGSFLRLGDNLAETELFEIKNFCALCKKIKVELTNLNLSLENLCLSPLEQAFDLLNKSNTEGFFISDDHSQNLAQIRQEKRRLAFKMQTSTGEERETFRKQHLNFSAMEEEETFKIRKVLSSLLLPYAKDMQHNANTIARLDLLLQKAFLAIKFDGILPTFDQEKFELCHANNPHIADILSKEGKIFTTISIIVDKTTVITGANMGGKTVALKTIALNAYCSICGFPLFAKKATLPHLNFVEILSEDLQSTDRGLSSFGGEVIKVNQLFKMAQKSRGLLLIDEFASGTNVQEGAKIFSALLQALKQTPSFALLTTHFDGVCKEATQRYQIIGLPKKAKQLLQNQGNVTQKNIAEYMNYGLVKVDNDAQIPKDALDICKLLGMCEEILSLVEK